MAIFFTINNDRKLWNNAVRMCKTLKRVVYYNDRAFFQLAHRIVFGRNSHEWHEIYEFLSV